MEEAMAGSMRGQREAGLVTGEEGPGQTVVWRLQGRPELPATPVRGTG
jgi:hypothetical protein